MENIWYHSPDWWVAIFTGVLALVTAVLCYYTYRLFQVALNTLKSADRPNLVIDKVGISVLELGKAAVFDFQLRNIGLSSAYLTTAKLGWGMSGLDQIPLHPKYENIDLHGLAWPESNLDFSIITTEAINYNQIDNIYNGKETLVFLGKIYFHDGGNNSGEISFGACVKADDGKAYISYLNKPGMNYVKWL